LSSFKTYVNNIDTGKALYQQNGSKQLSDEEKKKLGTRMLALLEPIHDWIHANKYAMVDAQQNCVQKIQSERSASLCYTCSGRAKQFFTGNSLHLHEMTCRTLINGCSSSWWYLINYLDQTNRFNDAIREIEREAGITLTDYKGSSPVKDMLSWADQNNLRHNLQSCRDGLCKFEVAKVICENFISIERPLYLNQALNIVENDNKIEQKLKKAVRNSSGSKDLKNAKNIVSKGFNSKKNKNALYVSRESIDAAIYKMQAEGGRQKHKKTKKVEHHHTITKSPPKQKPRVEHHQSNKNTASKKRTGRKLITLKSKQYQSPLLLAISHLL